MTLTLPVGEQDHSQGRTDAPIVLIQYGDFECPYSGAAYPAIKEAQEQLGERLLYVFRQFPLHDIHRHAMQASEAAEIAAAQGQFWPMHDLLFENQEALGMSDLERYAEQIGLDVERFRDDMQTHAHRERILQSIESGKQSGARGTPTFFINGVFHDNREGLWDAKALLAAIEETVNK
jgi:protein-disulfide isomerase